MATQQRDRPMAVHIEDAFIASAKGPVIRADYAEQSSVNNCHLVAFGLPYEAWSWWGVFRRRRLHRLAPLAVRAHAVLTFARWAWRQPAPTYQVGIKMEGPNGDH